jgi:hypothetical protein
MSWFMELGRWIERHAGLASRAPHAAGAGGERSTWGGFAGNPYGLFGGRPVREARLRSYIIREHRLGRSLGEILADPYVARCGSASLCWRVVAQPETISALAADDREAIERELASLAREGAIFARRASVERTTR